MGSSDTERPRSQLSHTGKDEKIPGLFKAPISTVHTLITMAMKLNNSTRDGNLINTRLRSKSLTMRIA